MFKIILALFGLLIYSRSLGQSREEKIMYVIDSIPVMEDPEQGNELNQNDVSDMTVIRNKDSLKLLGYARFDGAIFLFTKEYRNRPDSLMRVPSTKRMVLKDGIWLFHNVPYSGRIIDYYYSGRRWVEGYFIGGKAEGTQFSYYQNGRVAEEKNYKNGQADGIEKDYFEDGSLSEKGTFVNGKEEGLWESYYPNHQVRVQSHYLNGELTDSGISYYSSGKVRERVYIKNGKLIPDPSLAKITQWMGKSKESAGKGDDKEAIKYCSRVIEQDSTYANAYFSRGTLYLNNLQFDEAIADLDKALHFEPFLDVALANRAFARIRKYQFGNSRTLSNNNGVTVLASKDKSPIPAQDQQKICSDLHEAAFLGDRSKMINEALANYCPLK